MGTWGIHSFDNDAAAGFLAAVEAVDQPFEAAEAIGRAFDAAFAVPVSELDADAGATAIAAAEVVAAALGHPRDEQPKDPFGLEASVQVHDDLLAKAVAATQRVRADPSELAQLWAETGDAGDWRAAMADLEARLLAAAAQHALETGFLPPDEGGQTEEEAHRSEVARVYADMMATIETIADKAQGDPQVELLRHLTRKLNLVHQDISNMRYAVVDSLDALTARIDKLERADT